MKHHQTGFGSYKKGWYRVPGMHFVHFNCDECLWLATHNAGKYSIVDLYKRYVKEHHGPVPRYEDLKDD